MKSLLKEIISRISTRQLFVLACLALFLTFILILNSGCSVSRPRVLSVDLSGQVDNFELRDSSDVQVIITSKSR